MEAAFETLKKSIKDSIIPYIWMEEKDTSHSFGFKDPRHPHAFRYFRYEKTLTERFQKQSQEKGMICRWQSKKEGEVINEQFFLYLSDEEGWSKITVFSRDQTTVHLLVTKRQFLMRDFVFQHYLSALPEIEEVFLEIISDLPEFRLHVVTGNTKQKG